MNYKDCDMVKTPGGATLGERVNVDGELRLHYKAGKKEDDLTVEQLVECVSGKKVATILFEQEDEFLLKPAE